ncbi:hypothetical protein FRC19_003132 [Serendipita sp. 401]|nr:hypothetical protein FRC19_003132 [Serendipita sp. 401]
MWVSSIVTLIAVALLHVLEVSAIPAGAITVGSGKKYSTLAAALKDTSSNVYYVYAGTYTGQVAISRSNIAIYGETTNSASYTGNKVTFTAAVPASQAGSNDASGTIRVLASGVKLYNLNIANTYGKPVSQSQAIALSVQAGQFGCYGCKITGTQDTLLANVVRTVSRGTEISLIPLFRGLKSMRNRISLAMSTLSLVKLPPFGSQRASLKRPDLDMSLPLDVVLTTPTTT